VNKFGDFFVSIVLKKTKQTNCKVLSAASHQKASLMVFHSVSSHKIFHLFLWLSAIQSWKMSFRLSPVLKLKLFQWLNSQS